MEIEISGSIRIPEREIEWQAIRAQGAGGQNVNKVASAIQLRFDIRASSLPEGVKERLLAVRDRRITRDGCIVIKAQEHRTRERNRMAAMERLVEMIRPALVVPRMRKATRPGKAAHKRRLEAKTQRSRTKDLRRKVGANDM